MDWHSWTNLLGFKEPCGIHSRVPSTGEKVLRWSQWALLPTAVCLENVYLWFDPVKLAKVLTGIHERAGFPGLEELFPAWCQWLSCNAFTLGHFWYLHCIPWPWKCGFWCTVCHTFDILDHLIMRFVLMSAILENGAVCESHTLPTMSSRSFVLPTPQTQRLILDIRYDTIR